jgi:CRP/FNR family cyclic AMP-dependent transcriptional regulator
MAASRSGYTHPPTLRSLTDELGQLVSESFLAKLPPDAVSPLLANAVRVEYPAGTCICQQGDPPTVRIYASGLVRASRRDPDGRIVTQRYVRRGDIGGIPTLFSGRAAGQAHALVASTSYQFSARAWCATAQEDVRVAHALLQEVSRILAISLVHFASDALATTRQRVVRELLDVAANQQNGSELVVPLTQQQLAEGIGTAREVVARVLRGLRDERLVETGSRGVVLLDPVRLQAELVPAS